MRATIKSFMEVFINASIEVCEQRDPKGLYKKARAGGCQSFTGIHDPYEPPLSPELECRTDMESIKERANKVISAILQNYAIITKPTACKAEMCESEPVLGS